MKSELESKTFRDYFGGSWRGKIIKNGEFLREIVFNWPNAFEKFYAIGTEERLIAPSGSGFLDDTNKIAIGGWQPDSKRWVHSWFNKFGGYGEVQWRSQDVVNDIKVLYGVVHECKQESETPTDHIILCEMFDQNKFKYTIRSFKKGIITIDARRIRTAQELNVIMKDQVKEINQLLT